MGLYILFSVLIIFYIIDCVISNKLHRAKEKEVELLRTQLKVFEGIDAEVVNQRNVLYRELKKFNNSKIYVDDGK